MRLTTAKALIENLALKPGWTITVNVNYRFEDTLTLRFDYEAYNYNRENLEAGYNLYPIVANASFHLPVGNIDDPTDLYLEVMSNIMTIEQHEWREALRVKETGWAPFHPHRLEGMNRWGDLQGDYTFGLA